MLPLMPASSSNAAQGGESDSPLTPVLLTFGSAALITCKDRDDSAANGQSRMSAQRRCQTGRQRRRRIEPC